MKFLTTEQMENFLKEANECSTLECPNRVIVKVCNPHIPNDGYTKCLVYREMFEINKLFENGRGVVQMGWLIEKDYNNGHLWDECWLIIENKEE